jgi:hypothetical protein
MQRLPFEEPARPVPLAPLVALFCAALVIVGSFGAWGRLTTRSTELDTSGLQSDGRWTLVLASAALVAGGVRLMKPDERRWMSAIVLLALALAAAIGFFDWVNLERTVTDRPPNARIFAGWGLTLVCVGATFGVLAALADLATGAMRNVHIRLPRPARRSRTTPGAFLSGGLGLDRAAWEAVHGPPLSTADGASVYSGGRLLARYYNGAVCRVERRLTGEADQPLAQKAARTHSRDFLPVDVRFIESFPAGLDRTADRYVSPSLAVRFGAAPWQGAVHGVVVVVFHLSGDRVQSFFVSAGGNPYLLVEDDAAETEVSAGLSQRDG